MSVTPALIETEALKLSPEDRVLLADRVPARLRERGDVEQAWAAEIDRRLAEVEACDVRLVPAEEAIRHARQALP